MVSSRSFLLLLLLGCCCFFQSAAFSANRPIYNCGIELLAPLIAPRFLTRLKSAVVDAHLTDAPLIICENEESVQEKQQEQLDFPMKNYSKPKDFVDNNKGGVLGVPAWAIKKSLRVSFTMLTAVALLKLVATSGRGGVGAAFGSLPKSNHNIFQTGFYEAFTLVLISEIGDKSFFAAGLLALRTSRLASFIGSFGALALMTMVSVGIGRMLQAVQYLPNFWWGIGSGALSKVPLNDIAATAAFAYFGIKTLKEATDTDVSGAEEEEAKDPLELAEANEVVSRRSGSSMKMQEKSIWAQIASVFGLIFAAEFGDRSFLATIALASAQNPISVAWGATFAHALTTVAAVCAASYVARYVSEKTIHFVGGVLFILFAITTALGIF